MKCVDFSVLWTLLLQSSDIFVSIGQLTVTKCQCVPALFF